MQDEMSSEHAPAPVPAPKRAAPKLVRRLLAIRIHPPVLCGGRSLDQIEFTRLDGTDAPRSGDEKVELDYVRQIATVSRRVDTKFHETEIPLSQVRCFYVTDVVTS